MVKRLKILSLILISIDELKIWRWKRRDITVFDSLIEHIYRADNSKDDLSCLPPQKEIVFRSFLKSFLESIRSTNVNISFKNSIYHIIDDR